MACVKKRFQQLEVASQGVRRSLEEFRVTRRCPARPRARLGRHTAPVAAGAAGGSARGAGARASGQGYAVAS
jgi:hypothetical protein